MRGSKKVYINETKRCHTAKRVQIPVAWMSKVHFFVCFLGFTKYTTMESNDTDGVLALCCPMPGDERWYIFVITSVVLYVAGCAISFVSYLIYWLAKRAARSRNEGSSSRRKNMNETGTARRLFRKYREVVRQSISGDTIFSKILITLTFICNTIYLLIYIYRTYTPYPEGTGEDGACLTSSDDGSNSTTSASRVEKCFSLHSSPEFIVELVIVLELIFSACIRFLAADDVIHYWFQIYTLVDVFTLPHIFVSITLGVDWVGLRSLRFIWLPQIVNVIRFLPFVKSQDAVDVISLLIKFSALWLSCTGIIHLIEAQGDFWRNYENSGSDSFLTYAYFIMVTVSTVGYGDLSPSTDIGRAFITFFIILGLAFFAAILPTLVDVASGLYIKRQFAIFDTTRVPHHVIVCGHITAFGAEEFLKDFLHPDRGDSQTHVLFLHPERPDPELKNVIRSHYTRVQYIVGSVLNEKDLQRAKIHLSRAVFIVANKLTSTPLEEDNTNLLRLVSVKNTTTEIPVIIQLLLSRSKKQVRNIEGWKVGRDIVLCLNELKLGLLAQSCICPGISTLVANLFYIADSTIFPERETWKKRYIKGVSNEIYTSYFSRQFDRMKFHEAAKICYNKLGLILISLEKIEGKVRFCYVNPSPGTDPDLVIESGAEGMRGYFIGQDSDHVSVVASYCEHCHGDINAHSGDRMAYIRRVVQHVTTKKCRCAQGKSQAGAVNPRSLTEMAEKVPSKHTPKLQKKVKKWPKHIHWMSEDLDDLDELLNIYLCDPQKLEEAIVADENAIVSSSLGPNVKDHVVLCVFADETSPLLGLHNFLLPLRSKYMPKDQLKPVVIVSNKRFIEREWPLIHNIPNVHIVTGSPLRWQNLEEANINKCSVCIIISMLSNAKVSELAVNDKESILCSLSIKQHLKKTARRNVLVLTDLKLESNVQFLDFGDEYEPDERIYKAQPFACGEAFSVSMFDSVTSSAFHSPGTLYLIEDIITCRRWVNSQVVPLSLSQYAGKTFSEVYNDQLKKHAICLGLYRQLPRSNYGNDSIDIDMDASLELETMASSSSASPSKRYVITAPAPSLRIEETDMAFLLVEQRDSDLEMLESCI